jgi:hypothetical protein
MVMTAMMQRDDNGDGKDEDSVEDDRVKFADVAIGHEHEHERG